MRNNHGKSPLGQEQCPGEFPEQFSPGPALLLLHKMAMQSNHLPQPQAEALSPPLPSCSGRAWGCQKQGLSYSQLICTRWDIFFNLTKTPELKPELG